MKTQINLIKLTKIVSVWKNNAWINTGTEEVLLNPAMIIKVENRSTYCTVTFNEGTTNAYEVLETKEEIYNLANGIK